MRWTYYLFLFICISCTLFEKEEPQARFIQEFYDNKGVLAEKRIFDPQGKLDKQIYFQKSGKYQAVITWKNEKRHGPALFFDSLGRKTEAVNYCHGNLTGRFINYYPEGMVQKRGMYYKGKGEGQCISYFKSGKPNGYFQLIQGKTSNSGEIDENGNVKTDHPFFNIFQTQEVTKGKKTNFLHINVFNFHLIEYAYLKIDALAMDSMPILNQSSKIPFIMSPRVPIRGNILFKFKDKWIDTVITSSAPIFIYRIDSECIN